MGREFHVRFCEGLGVQFPRATRRRGANIRLTQAVEQGRKLSNEEWKEVRDETADDIAWLLAGADLTAAREMKAKVIPLLDKARKVPEKEWKTRKSEIEVQMTRLAGRISPV